MFPETVETDSLVLRRLSPEYVDVFEFYDLFADGDPAVADVFEYIALEPFETLKDAQEMLEGAHEEWEAGDYAKYAVYEDGETLAGMTALTLKWDRQKASLAVILAKPFWGRGFAGECAFALTGIAFERLDLEVVSLGYDEGNERSRGAIESFVDRVGGKREGTIRNETPRGDEVADNTRYSVTREEYRAAVTDS